MQRMNRRTLTIEYSIAGMTPDDIQNFAAGLLIANGRAVKAEITARAGTLECILRPDNEARRHRHAAHHCPRHIFTPN
jgi:hypothetical protein